MHHKLNQWTNLSTVTPAPVTSDPAPVLRAARAAAGLSQAEVGRVTGYSISTVCRWEKDNGRSWKASELHKVATILGVPLHLVGLVAASDPHSVPEIASVGSPLTTRDCDDVMRRRDLLSATAVVTGAVLMPGTIGTNPADLTIEDVAFGDVAVPPLPYGQLASRVAAAAADMRATRFQQLTRRLPHLMAIANANLEHASVAGRPSAASMAARTYILASQLLIKLHDNPLAAATADRARQYAHQASDPVLAAEAMRMVATVVRRGPRPEAAGRLITQAAQQLDAATGLATPDEAACYSRLIAAGAYTAALRDDHDTAWNLLDESAQAFIRAKTTGTEVFNNTEIQVYKLSIARVLGDYGTAVHHARAVNPATITAPERRARYWQDTAMSLYSRGRPDDAYRILQTAEDDTPQEVRYRPWAQELTTQLLRGPSNHTGLHEFATKIGIPNQ